MRRLLCVPRAGRLFVSALFPASFLWLLWCTSALYASIVGPWVTSWRALDTPARAVALEKPKSTHRLYKKYCAKCHGDGGAGSKSLSTHVPDFTSPAWQRERSRAQLLVSIRDGKGRFMPGFADRLSDKELNELVTHVRSFAPPERLAGTQADDPDFDKRFQELELELEQMRREFWRLNEASKPENCAAPPKIPP